MGLDEYITGSRFVATLSIRVPLAILERHGEVCSSPPDDAPVFFEMHEGDWLPVCKPPRVSIYRDNLPPHEVASETGPTRDVDGYIRFLKAFRLVVESKAPPLAQVERIKALSDDPALKPFADRYENLPREWFCVQIRDALKVGPKTAETLYDAGFLSASACRSADPGALAQLPGVGPATVRKIKKGA